MKIVIWTFVYFISTMVYSFETDVPVCKTLSLDCAVCSNATKIDPRQKDGKPLVISDYACAVGTKFVPKIKTKPEVLKSLCKPLSSFCSLCADEKFYFINKDEPYKNIKEISSDLFECATAPRTKMGNLNEGLK